MGLNCFPQNYWPINYLTDNYWLEYAETLATSAYSVVYTSLYDKINSSNFFLKYLCVANFNNEYSINSFTKNISTSGFNNVETSPVNNRFANIVIDNRTINTTSNNRMINN